MSEPRRYCTREGKGCGDEYCTRNPGIRTCCYEYDETKSDPAYAYNGKDWPPPRRWVAADGTHVYRSFADYLDD